MSGMNAVSGRADINQVLAEMRNLRSQVQQTQNVPSEINPSKIQGVQEAKEVPSFSEMFGNAINSVNSTQKASSQLATAYEQGDPNVTLSQVMIQSQKASVSFTALSEVRNKVVQAYQDVMKMPI